jgi:hypothetical protein
MFLSTPSLTTYQKLTDLDLELVLLIESLCVFLFMLVGVGWDGMGLGGIPCPISLLGYFDV